ncbi:methionine aminotransferase [Luteibaculum oceani]|uniref:Aminotransferase class I/II-fold pyridoxal phosphate-dependent enzyme n=1 Tax=Luteibaculum oceani TaxID=1294296 RepID=A0A5C6V361_9FLAO|nr:methionine aminotransferase [Luteibaculum oceani]TXC78986.1 aminotransferase class I/II-fold pyridoxal phosphate-dependent enzyme [Luteibaculum oceani]
MLASSVSLQTKLPAVGKTIFSKMSEMALEYGAINLSQGFPDAQLDPLLQEEVTKAMLANKNQYAPAAGTLELRTAISKYAKRQFEQSYDPQSEVLITSGATQALQSAITALVKEGDEVIIFTPAYDSYVPAVELAGATPVYCRLKYPDYSIDWKEFKRLVNRKTKLVILNSPHNPSGRLLSSADIDQLIRLTDGTDILILSDEVYHNILFDGKDHHSMASYPKLAERSIVVGSLGKMLNVTGWKIGFCLAPKLILSEILKVHQYTVFSVNTPMQLGVASFLEKYPNKINELLSPLQAKRDLFVKEISKGKFKALPCDGSYFCLLNYSEISDEDDVKFSEWLAKEVRVSAIPLSVFYHNPEQNKVLRFCFAKEDDVLIEAAKRLNAL